MSQQHSQIQCHQSQYNRNMFRSDVQRITSTCSSLQSVYGGHRVALASAPYQMTPLDPHITFNCVALHYAHCIKCLSTYVRYVTCILQTDTHHIHALHYMHTRIECHLHTYTRPSLHRSRHTSIHHIYTYNSYITIRSNTIQYNFITYRHT